MENINMTEENTSQATSDNEENYLNNEKYQQIHQFLRFSTEKNLLLKLQELPYQKKIQLLQNVGCLEQDFVHLLEIIKKFKGLIKALSIILSATSLEETLSAASLQISSLLGCERAQIYLLNKQINALEVSLPRGIVQVQLNKGIAGYVAINGLPARIDCAPEDSRYDEQFDSNFSLKTRTVVAVPLINDKEKVEGVLEVSNKIAGRFFQEDQALLELIGKLGSVIFANASAKDQYLGNQHKLIKLIDIGIHLFECLNLEILIQQSRIKLRELLNVDKLPLVYIFDKEKKQLIKYEQDQETICPIDIGIVGEVIRTKKMLYLTEPYQNPLFNSVLDIQTNLPIVTVPIIINENEIIGVYQTLLLKAGFQKNIKEISIFDSEYLGLFSKILGICIDKTQRVSDIINDQIQIKLDELQKGSIRLKKLVALGNQV